MNYFLFYQLKPEELELRYRAERLAKDKIQVLTFLALTIVIILGFIVLDFRFFPSGITLHTTITSRLVAVASSLLAAWQIYRQSMVKTFDRIMFSWVVLIATHMMIVSAVRPADYGALVAWDVFVIFAVYIVIPMPLHFQMVSALFLTIGSSMLWLVYKAPPWHPLETVSILGAYLFSNIYGILVSRQLNLSRRRQFCLLVQEQEAKGKLQKTLAEVKVLRGILPICSFCKKIRNDKGYFETVEAYVDRHSEAEFSHTLCPECLAEHYSDILE